MHVVRTHQGQGQTVGRASYQYEDHIGVRLHGVYSPDRIEEETVDSPGKHSSEQDQPGRDAQLEVKPGRIRRVLGLDDSTLVFGSGRDDLIQDDGGGGDEFRERHEEGQFGARRGHLERGTHGEATSRSYFVRILDAVRGVIRL